MLRRDFLKTTTTGVLATVAPPTLFASKSQQQSAQEKNPKIKEIRDRIKPITDEERQVRLEKARRLMHDQGIDALLFDAGVNLKYFTNINWGRSERLFAMILPKNGEPQYIAPKFEESRAQEQVGNARLLTWEEHESPYTLVQQILKDNTALTGTLGVEETTRHFVTENIGKEISTVKLVSGTPITAECRCVKSPHEIELMQIADDITAEVFKASIPQLREGMTEREFGSIISKEFSAFGVGGGALVLFGEASAHPHGLEKQHVLREGDIVLIDGGCSVEGYSSDVTRTQYSANRQIK